MFLQFRRNKFDENDTKIRKHVRRFGFSQQIRNFHFRETKYNTNQMEDSRWYIVFLALYSLDVPASARAHVKHITIAFCQYMRLAYNLWRSRNKIESF